LGVLGIFLLGTNWYNSGIVAEHPEKVGSDRTGGKASRIDAKVLIGLLKLGVESEASDIHFEAGSPPRYRVNGELVKAKFDTLTPGDTLAIAQLLLGKRQLDLERIFPEQDISYSLHGVSRFRVSIFRQRGSVGCVMRVIASGIPSFKELNLPPIMSDIAVMPRGLVLITGSTGMGKSTTIAAIIEHVNQTKPSHIITIEDPIEFLFDNKKSLIIQREVGTDTKGFAEAMVTALRQDPDIIMLGEVRDDISANACLRAAETGHLVITTLHTPDVTSSIKRFTGFFDQVQTMIQLDRMAGCLQAIISQRLIQKADGTGLVPAVEIMRVTHTLQECIRNPEKHVDILDHMSQGRDVYRMQTFDQHLGDLVKARKVTLETAKLAATNPADLERSIMLE
jgi:twitching motility protein PilT